MAVYYSTIEYNANGGSGAPAATRRVDTVYQSTGAMAYEYVRVDYGVPTRTGYNFINWKYTQYDVDRYAVGGDQIQFQYSFNGYDQHKTVTCYAQWQVQTYTISYNANGGTGAPSAQTKTYGTNLTLSSTVPTRTNYIFQGWATSSTGAVQYQPGGTFTANANTILYAIWKQAAATLNSVSDTAIGSNGTASWTKINEAHTYKLVLSVGVGASIEVNNISAGSSSVGFTIPSSWLSALSNSTSATATATLYTYNNGTLVGSTSKSFTVSVPSTVKPSISAFTAVPHSANNTVEGWGVAVQGYSYLTLSVTASAGTGASVSNINFTGHGISQSSTATTGDTAIVTSTGSQSYSVTVTDSRGRTATSTVSVTVYEYANPNVSSFNVVRCLSNGTQSDTEGNYIKALPVFVFSSVNSHNTLTGNKIEYKAHDSSTWLNGPTSLTSGSWCSPFGPADITKAFDVRFTITDSLGNTFAIETIVQSVVGFALGLKNDRARFGGPVEKAGLQVDWPAEFNDAVDITNRRCSATLSSSGWYRVLKSANVSGSIIHVSVCVAEIAEVHEIDFCVSGTLTKFTNEASVGNQSFVDKIRFTTADTLLYIDVHYNSSSQKTVNVNFEVFGYAQLGNTTAESLQSVADAPSGETVVTTYDFVANTHISDSVAGSYGTIYYDRKGGVCSIYGDVTGVPTGAWTTLATGLPAPARTQFFIAQNGASTDFVMCQLNTSGTLKFYGRGSYSSGYPTWTYVCN